MSGIDDSHNLMLIAINLGIINDLIQTKIETNHRIAIKYMNELQKYGCKLRVIQGNVQLVEYTPVDLPITHMYSKL